MRKHFSLFLFFPILLLIIYCGGCKENAIEITQPEQGSNNSITKSFTSSSGGTIDYDNFQVIVPDNSISTLENGSQGTVVFSVTTSQNVPSGLPALPAGFTQISKFVTVGPEGFIFTDPIHIYFPVSNESTPGAVRILAYIPSANGWKFVPYAARDSVHSRIGISVLKLGSYVLVRSSVAVDDYEPWGGVQYCHYSLYDYFYLTINSVTLNNPNLLQFFENGMVGTTYSSPGTPGVHTVWDYCRGTMPLGTYQFWISVRSPSDYRMYTYSLPVTVNVNTILSYPQGWPVLPGSGWTNVCEETGGTWNLGPPNTGPGAWPTPTIPYGSGTFQGTLTWVNTSNDHADLDLHLYGPNGMHVYYGNNISSDSTFRLDRDWMNEQGNATENIYSIKSLIPKGDYEVKASHYSGDAVSFSARVILNGAATNISGTLSSGQSVLIKSFTIQ